ncbi:MAG: radical SAM protein [Candidatus Dojkabacteria bacterium]|nr:radical SAM protein [Candidatus Dojkabacteria bacterium]
MTNEITAKSILRRNRRHIDDWFCGSYGLAPYYGCQHACVYCDGRYEKYGFEGEFGKDVNVKKNTIELLKKEIKLVKEPGYVFIGSGITDAYQPIEKKYRLTRRSIETIADHPLLSLHILTKSAFVEDDLELIAQIAKSKRKKAIISFSIAFDNDENRKKFEPGTAEISQRWRIITKAQKMGINTGVYLIPAIPFISDSEEEIRKTYEKCVKHKVDFVLSGGMTLKIGRQKQFYLEFIKKLFPKLYEPTVKLYSNADHYGSPVWQYSKNLYTLFNKLSREYKLKVRIPQHLLKDILPNYYESALMLSHMGEYLRQQGINRKAYAYAGHSIQKWAYEAKKGRTRRKDFNYGVIEKAFLEEVQNGEIMKLPSIGDKIQKMLMEFVETGNIKYYNKLSSYTN